MAAPQCTKCSRLNSDHSCDAFPCGIPDEIFLGWHDHRKPYTGDDGIVFEKISEIGLAGSRFDGSYVGEGGVGELTGKVDCNGNFSELVVEGNGQLSFKF